MKVKEAIKNHLSKIKETKSVLAWVWRDLINERSKKISRVMIFVTLAGHGLLMVNPWIVGLMFGDLIDKAELASIVKKICLYVFVVVIGILVKRQGTLMRKKLRHEISCNISREIAKLFFSSSIGRHIEQSDDLNEPNITRGSMMVNQLQFVILDRGIDVIIGFIFPFIALLFFDAVVALVMIIPCVFHLVWSIVLNERVMAECIPINRKHNEVNRYVIERMRLVERVKVESKEEYEVENISEKIREVSSSGLKFWFWFINQDTKRSIFSYTFLVLVVIFGVVRVFSGSAEIYFLYPLIAWTSQLIGGLEGVSALEHEINYTVPSISEMKRSLLSASIEEKELVPSAEPYMIEFRDVSFSFDDKPVLNGISFVVKPGQKVAILGESGIGKTTITRLLMGYMSPDSGRIEINGIEIRNLNRKALLRSIGRVPVQLFDETIRYNLLYGLTEEQKKSISEEDIQRTVELAQIDFRDGLDTRVGLNGSRLSEGEAQRVMIGAIAIKKPRLVIFDEATNSLDMDTEYRVQEGLERVLSVINSTAIIIAHRLSTVVMCDKFIFLEDKGSGAEIGAIADSLNELVRKSESFRRMAERQNASHC